MKAIPSHTRRRRRGFTLIEILIVLAIIGVIAAMAVPNLMNQQQTGNKRATVMVIKSVQDACNLYAVDHNGELPEGGDEVWTLLTQVDEVTKSTYLDKIPLDAWGKPLHYQWPNQKAAVQTDRPAIWSDGRYASDPSDDINNWDDLVQTR